MIITFCFFLCAGPSLGPTTREHLAQGIQFMMPSGFKMYALENGTVMTLGSLGIMEAFNCWDVL